MDKANFRGQDFTAENLRDQDLSNRDFRRCKFIDADLSNANLSGCIFIKADFNGADLSNADISNTDFEKALNIDKANFIGAYWNNRMLTINPVIVANDRYFFMVADAFIQIGCSQKTKSDWLAMTDEQIKELGRVRVGISKAESDLEAEQALAWWNQYKGML